MLYKTPWLLKQRAEHPTSACLPAEAPWGSPESLIAQKHWEAAQALGVWPLSCAWPAVCTCSPAPATGPIPSGQALGPQKPQEWLVEAMGCTCRSIVSVTLTVCANHGDSHN